jgi:hypothetical protein
MDALLKQLKDIKLAAKFDGTVLEFVALDDFTAICKKLKVVPVNIKLSMLPQDGQESFVNYLVEITHKFVLKEKIESWSEFKRHPDCFKIEKLLFQFGVRGALFPLDEENSNDGPLLLEDRKITFFEFYELCQIQFNFDGSFGSFKKMISKKYGSFAEYCLSRGYDINNTKWESDETAIRVARKIGSPAEVKAKSSSLYKYLDDRNLFPEAFDKKAS